MNISYFTHSLRSDWNHGNAHFLRGVASELVSRGHRVRVWEPRDNWSAQNLEEDAGNDALEAWRARYPTLDATLYDAPDFAVDESLVDEDVVIVHEWNEAELVAQIGARRAQSKWKLLFHDTHHRAASAPDEMRAFDLTNYDGVLAFGATVSELYRRNNWAKRAWTWHEAADTRLFHPIEGAAKTHDLVWIGNWGDNERTRELGEFLIEPVRELGLGAKIYGVRYPAKALESLCAANIEYGGYLPNFRAPDAFARARVTVHVPRGPYVEKLPGIPTIRPFEALACGIPLISAPWNDSENLFRVGVDYLVARDGNEMKAHLRAVLSDEALRDSLISHGSETVRARHTCAHRVDELLAIVGELE